MKYMAGDALCGVHVFNFKAIHEPPLSCGFLQFVSFSAVLFPTLSLFCFHVGRTSM